LDTVAVNGPEGDVVDWDAVDWRRVEDDVRRLRQRIFTATRAGDLKRVRNLQKLALRSRANALLSVRRVTEVNAGRKTAGVDGRVVLMAEDKADLAAWVQHGTSGWCPRPVKRVYIPKANGKQRGLGIPVIADRALQAVTVNALEPEWEARFESRSYGFRPGRGCQDAMQAIFVTARGATCKRQWVLDADLAAAFDRIDHSRLLDQLGTFPARGMISAWLTAGVMDQGRFAPTERGSPQGGVISPVLMNVALHGMEEAAGVRYIPTGTNAGTARPGSPVLIRYADDLLALCHSREQAEQVKARLAAWLAPRGLVFNEDKTAIVHLDDGVDFLGFNVRRYRGKLLIKPSKAAVKRIRARLTAEMKALRGHNAQMVLIRLNPIIRGWSAYYRHAVSARVFNELDNHVWKARLQVGEVLPSAQVEALDHRPVLRCVQLKTARPVGVRRPRQRRPPAQVRLDEDHPAHPGQGLGVPGRPGPGSLLGGPATTRETPAGPGQAPAPAEAARALPALRAAAAPHRPRAGTPRRMGTLDHSDPQGARPPCAHPRHRTRGRGRHHRVPSRPRSLPGPPARRHPKLTSTSAAPTRSPPGLA
jgi:RNA-directed DNA polymerase